MRLLLLALSAMMSVAGCDGAHCDPDALAAALGSASSGDVVRVGSCRVEGAFTVPPGVVLQGSGAASTLASSGAAGPVVELESEAGGAPSRLEDLTVESRASAGVVVRGPGSVEISRVSVEALRGLGVGIDGATTTLTDVEVRGEVTPDTVRDPMWQEVIGFPLEGLCTGADCACQPGDIDAEGRRACSEAGRFVTWTSVFGIYARDAELTLTNVDIVGIAQHGLVVDASDVRVSGGSIRTIVGVGLLSRDSTLELTGFTVEGISRGLRGAPSYALLATDGAMSTVGLEVLDNDDFGLVQLAGRADHRGLVVTGNGNVGLWIGGAESATVRDSSRIVDNGFAGAVFSDASGVVLDDVLIEGTRQMVVSTSLFGVQEIGDGIVLTGTGDASLRDVTLRGNERAGLIVDLGGSATDVTFEGVSVEASGAAFGALSGTRDASTGVVTVGGPAGWDTGIVRVGAATANDALATGDLDFIVTAGPESAAGARGIVAPMY